MAQWVPKTAWKVSNLNKRYGPSYVTSGFGLDSSFGRAPSVYDTVQLQRKLSEQKGMSIIDVRGTAERRRFEVPGAVVLHPHDILSGAACPILPQRKEDSELFVLAADHQHGVNSLLALRRWGYESVTILDYDTLVKAGYVKDAAMEE